MRRGLESGAANEVLDALAAAGLQSDRRFAEGLLRARSERGYGPVRILAELRRHGIAEECIAGILDWQDPKWAERIAELRAHRFGVGYPRDPAERARQARFLQRRGFSAEQIRRLMGDEDI